MDEILKYFWILIFLLPLLQKLFLSVFKRRQKGGHDDAAVDVGSDAGAELRQRAEGVITQMRERLWALSTETARLRERAAETPGPASVLVGALERLGKEQREIQAELDAASAAASHGDFTSLGELAARVEWESMRVRAVEHMLSVRSDPVLGERMDDADAIADALARPLVDFGKAQGVDIPEKRVVCVPAEQGAESIWFGLLPRGYPTIFVPDDFESDLMRWPALAHEMGHLMWRDVPGLAQEIHQRTGLTVAPFLIHSDESWDLRPCYAAWLQEIFCDTMGALQLGPPALRGAVYFFSSPRTRRSDPRTITVTEQSYDEHPPPHLRVLLIAHALRSQGFHSEVSEIMGRWDELVGPVKGFALPLAYGGATAVPADVVIAPGRQLVDALLAGQFNALEGFPIPSIPGFALSPGLWGRVERTSKALLAGDAPRETARVLIAAAVEAQAAQPGAAAQIARRVSRAIVGPTEALAPRKAAQSTSVSRPSKAREIGSPRDVWAEPSSQRGSQRASSSTTTTATTSRRAAVSASEFVEAMVLREVLQRRGNKRRGPLGRRPNGSARL